MIPSITDDFLTDIDEKAYPSYTYRMIKERNIINGVIDGQESLRQAIFKRLQTQKGMYAAYSSDYGIELNDLFGMPFEWVQAVLPDRIKEALLLDDRITEVFNFSFERISKGKLSVTFKVRSLFGEFKITGMEVITGV